jgi:hypothetical protein
MKAKITYRGWPGHFCMGHRCVFHLNTLIEFGEKRVVVSTVGDMRPTARIEEIGLDRYFETMAFYAVKEGKYWEANMIKRLMTGKLIRDISSWYKRLLRDWKRRSYEKRRPN